MSSTPTTSSEEEKPTTITTDLGFLPIPTWLQYDPSKPPHFGIVLNATFGFAGTFIVANLYYCQPLLIDMSKSFKVDYNTVSKVPTLIQAGYAVGLVFIAPLGDLVRRRPLMLLLVIISASLTIGLALTRSFALFAALSFLVGVASVVPQILMPLAADLAPPEKRAAALSVVLSGLLLGLLLARVLAGVVGQFASWRVVFYMAVGAQYLVFLLLYLVLPDYPAKNPELTYLGILWSMAKYCVTEPLLVQSALVTIASSACFTNFWVTLTFLLGAPPYNYDTLDIGLFGLVGMFGVATSPFVGRLIDRLVPWYAALVATLGLLIAQAVQTAAGGLNIAAVIIACLGLDLFRQTQQIAMTARVFGIEDAARARLNSVMLLALFIGQVMGTATGSMVFVAHGWRAASALSMAWIGWQLLILLLRGPHVGRFTWFGYEGGLEARKGIAKGKQGQADEEKQSGDDKIGDDKTVQGVEGAVEKKAEASGESSSSSAKEKDQSEII